MKTPQESAIWHLDDETGEVMSIEAGTPSDDYGGSHPSKADSPLMY